MNEEQKERNIPASLLLNNNQNIAPVEKRQIKSWHNTLSVIFLIISIFLLLQALFTSFLSVFGVISTLVLAIIPSLFVFFRLEKLRSWQIVFVGIIIQEFISLIMYLLITLFGFIGSFDIGKLFFNTLYILIIFVYSLFNIDNIILLFLGIACTVLLYYNKNIVFKIGVFILNLILWAIITYDVASKGREHAFDDFISGGGILAIFILLAGVHNLWKSGFLLISQKNAAFLGISVIILCVSLSFMVMRYILHLWYWDLGY